MRYTNHLAPASFLLSLQISSYLLVGLDLCVTARVDLNTDTCDINVSPDKRAIFLHNEQNLIQALKVHKITFLRSFPHPFQDSFGRNFCFISLDV